MCFIKPRLNSLLDGQLTRKNYLQISGFLDLVLVEQEKVPHTLQKATKRATKKVVKKQLVERNLA